MHDTSWRVLQIHVLNVMLQRAVMLQRSQREQLCHGPFSATIQHRAMRLGWMMYHEKFYRSLCSMSCFSEQSCLSDHQGKNFDMDFSQQPYNIEQWNLGGWYIMKSTTDPCAQCHASVNSHAPVIMKRKNLTDFSQQPYNIEQWNLGRWYIMNSTTDLCAQFHAPVNSHASAIEWVVMPQLSLKN